MSLLSLFDPMFRSKMTSKTDQYRDGAWIVVASSGKATCPVAMMNRYLERAGLSCDSPLFCQLSKIKCVYAYN